MGNRDDSKCVKGPHQHQIQNDVLELKLRAERRLGELIGETVKPGNPQLLHDETIGRLPQGVSRTQSHRYQEAASVPECIAGSVR